VVVDRFYVMLIALAALAGFVAIAYLVVRTFGQTGETWDKVGFWNFLTGTEWAPSAGKYGALPAIYGTLVTSAIAMVIAVPIAVAVAIATTVMLPVRLRGFVAGIIDLLAAIPSVVYGLWGFLVLVPAAKPSLEWVSRHNMGLGALEGPVLGGSLILAGLVLAVMILPIITAVVREVLATVPVEQQEAALALGATRWEMIRGAMLPWARSGIVGASALGLGRAVGETVAVALVLGSQPRLFESLLGSGQTLAATIAFEYNGAVDSLHTSTLVAMAVTVFVVAFVINLLARALVSRAGRGEGPMRRGVRYVGEAAAGPLRSAADRMRPARPAVPGSPWAPTPPRPPLRPVSRSRRIRSRVAEIAIMASVPIALVPLGLLIGYCVSKGLDALSLDFFTSDGEPDVVGNGIKHALIGTVILIGIATVVAAPLGILTALFMREAATRGPVLRRIGGALGTYVDVLLGVPSVVAGITISIAIVLAMGKFTALAGGLALAFIMYPIVVRSADEILRLVPQSHVEGALALGAPRWRTTWSVVLPAAAPGLLTGVMIAVARVSGETAPLLFTAGGAQFLSTNVLEPITALPVYIFNGTINSTVPEAQQHAWGAALVLVAFVLILNLFARLAARLTRALEAR
jgi:phosphate transport system permease protein